MRTCLVILVLSLVLPLKIIFGAQDVSTENEQAATTEQLRLVVTINRPVPPRDEIIDLVNKKGYIIELIESNDERVGITPAQLRLNFLDILEKSFDENAKVIEVASYIETATFEEGTSVTEYPVESSFSGGIKFTPVRGGLFESSLPEDANRILAEYCWMVSQDGLRTTKIPGKLQPRIRSLKECIQEWRLVLEEASDVWDT